MGDGLGGGRVMAFRKFVLERFSKTLLEDNETWLRRNKVEVKMYGAFEQMTALDAKLGASRSKMTVHVINNFTHVSEFLWANEVGEGKLSRFLIRAFRNALDGICRVWWGFTSLRCLLGGDGRREGVCEGFLNRQFREQRFKFYGPLDGLFG